MPWDVDLPEDVQVGDPDHADMHNASADAIRELRDQVDGLAARVDALEDND